MFPYVVCMALLNMKVVTNTPTLTRAFLTFRSENEAAFCRAMISVNFGCLNVPGEGIGVSGCIDAEAAFEGVERILETA